MANMATVILKKGEGCALKAGGAWIYDNEIDQIRGDFENGNMVQVADFDGYPMGQGFINTNSKITVRMMTRKKDAVVDDAFVEFLCADVFDLLPELEQKGETFDVVILDPPAFTKSRSSIKNAVKGYREINLRGMKLVKDGGYLATCSCSHFMDPELFTKTIREAATSAHKRLRQVEYRAQAADHPILWMGGEQASYYLKFYIFQVCEEK